MKVLVTGGAGFIGSNIVEAYFNKGFEVVIIDNLSTGKEEYIHPKATFYKTDICSDEFLKIVEKEKPDVINHQAAQIDVQTSIKDPMYDAKINILGTINVLEACRLNPNTSIVYASSAAVYGTPEYLGIDENHPVKPISSYGISKHTPEHYIQAYHNLYGIQYSILRYANVYGKHQDPKGEGGVISILVDCAVKGSTFNIFGDGEQTRDFIHVSDIVTANIKATEKPINNIVNISTGTQISINKLVELFEEVIGFNIEKKYCEERKGDIKHSFLINNSAKDLLSWEPKTDLKDGLYDTFKFYKQKFLKENLA
jgi:UDP-glucose 4-epimerase